MKSLKEKYLESALKYAFAFKAIFEDSIMSGPEYKKLSRQEKAASKKCNEIFVLLKEKNELSEIEDLMFHENPYVRYLASAACLFQNPTIAEKTLEQLIESDNHKIRMHALTTLKAWRKIPWTEDRYK
jgi:hypothetical protein